MAKITHKEKENQLIEKIAKAKKDLLRLQNKRKIEIGMLAVKNGLDGFSNSVLDAAFKKLAKELNEHSK